jgi:DNA-binding NarL/FixJ family response regulator
MTSSGSSAYERDGGREAAGLMAGNANNGATILIADNEAEPRSIAAAVLRKAGYRVIEADNGDDAIDAARLELPRLVILEVKLPALSGYEVCHQLKDDFGQSLPIILVSAERTEPFDRVAGILIGADDYVVKPFAPDELLVRVRRLVRSTTPVAPIVASRLTARETEVLRHLAAGLGPAEIASRLFISRRTVGTHLENIMRKLGVRSRAQAVALAYREELVSTSES